MFVLLRISWRRLWSIETGLLIIRDWFPVADARRGLSDSLAPKKRHCFIGRSEHGSSRKNCGTDWKAAHGTSTLTGGSNRDSVRPIWLSFCYFGSVIKISQRSNDHPRGIERERERERERDPFHFRPTWSNLSAWNYRCYLINKDNSVCCWAGSHGFLF